MGSHICPFCAYRTSVFMSCHCGMHRKSWHSPLFFLSTYPQASPFSWHTSEFVFRNKGVHWLVTLVGCYYHNVNAHVDLSVFGGIYIKVNAFCFRNNSCWTTRMCVTHLSCLPMQSLLMKAPQTVSLFSVGFPSANYSGPLHSSFRICDHTACS